VAKSRPHIGHTLKNKGLESQRVKVRDQNRCVFWWRVVTVALLFVMVVPPVPAVGPNPKVVEGVVIEGVVVGLSPVDGVVLPFPAVLGLEG